MKTAITKIMDIIEMEHNNGVDISQRVLWKILNEAKEEEKQQIIDAVKFTEHTGGYSGEEYYNDTFETNKETLK